MAGTNGQVDTKRALGWLGLILLGLVLLAIVWFGGKVLLLAFAGILFAVVLRAPMGVLERRLGFPHRLAYATVLVLLVGVLVGFGFLVGPRVAEQAAEFSDRVPGLVENAQSYLEQRQWGRWLMGRIDGGGAGGEGGAGNAAAQGSGSASQVASSIGGALRRITITLTDFAFVVVLALFLALNPDLYRRGLVRLFPAGAQQRAGETVDELGRTLQAWLVGQLALMLLTGVLTGIGLVILGIPLALALAFFVGLMEFVPLIGPIVGFIPIVIMAASQGASSLLWVAVLYVVIQQIEGNVLTPLIQQRAVDLPPGLTIGAVFLGGALFGPLGVILGTPLMAVLFVTVKMLYVHDVLGQTVEVPGKEEPA
ncbi:MAG: AI-2E family transporter [Trueperaceae bacterium]